MMNPLFTQILFILTVILTLFFFIRIFKWNLMIMLFVMIWIIIQSAMAGNGFYEETDTFPPRIMLFLLIPVLSIILVFSLAKGRRIIDGIDPMALIVLHTVRIPVEICLYLLYKDGQVPELMTFEGRNFDVLSGLTAILIWFICRKNPTGNKTLQIVWNLICLALLVNIVANAILSVPGATQKQAFDQPNVAVLHYPYSILPAFIVPAVLFCHLASLKQLLGRKNQIGLV